MAGENTESELRAEIARLNKIVQSLMDRAERSTEAQGSDFSLFQTSVALEEEVRARTAELEAALRNNESVSRALRDSEYMYRSVITTMVEGVVFQAQSGEITSMNPAAERILGLPREALIGHTPDALPWPTIREDGMPFPLESHPSVVTWRSGEPQFGVVMGLCKSAGVITWIAINSQPIADVQKRSGKHGHHAVVVTFHDITAQKWIEARDRLRNDILQKLAHGLELPALLDALIRGIELEQPGRFASILLVDDEGRLHKGAAPSLPISFFESIEGMPFSEDLCVCGAPAFRGEPILLEDIRRHCNGQRFCKAIADAGVAACWSQPVLDHGNRIVASITLYLREPSVPTEQDQDYLLHAANLARIAITHHRDEETLRIAMRALETTRECVYWLDERGRILYANPAVEQELGYTAAELRRMSIPDIDPSIPAEQWHHDSALAHHRRAGELRNYLTHHRHRDGHLIPVEIHSDSFVYDGKDYVMSFAYDVSERLAAAEALQKSEAKFAALFSLTPDPLALTRLRDGKVLEISRSFADYFGYTRDEVIGHSTLPGDLSIWNEGGQRRQWTEKLEREGEVHSLETLMQRKDGTVVSVLVSGKVVDMGDEPCVIAVAHDITEQKEQAVHLEQIAHHDPLTGLPNRLLLGDRLRQAIAQNQRAGTRVAVCYLDLDGFKRVNDRFGHQVGDQLLVEVANRLVSCVRSGDTVARLGGDEFVVLLAGLAGDEECRAALERILRVVSAPYTIGGSEHGSISASIGVTLFPRDQTDPDTLVRHADHAMYAAKQAGKNRYQWFDTHLEQRIEARNATLQRVAEALKERQLCLYYQPKVDCRQGRVVGSEALIRWRHPTMGLLSPAEFLPLIEDTDLALDVGDWVLREALAQMTRWRREGFDLHISVNAFIRQLMQPEFVGALAELLARHPGAESERLQIEIVETAALRELDTIRETIEACRKLGVVFSLDDFGTGYSTLAHLRHLPANEIKIDQSFVRSMLERPEDRAIVESVIGLGRAFGRSVVAEGVETAEHIVHLLALGCDVMQGYALARPLAAADMPRWLREFRPDPAWRRPADKRNA